MNSAYFLIVLTTVFVILKMEGVTDWAWGWVVSPVFVPGALALALALWWNLERLYHAVQSWTGRSRRMRDVMDDDEGTP